jgi:hypothetical protein
MGLFGDFGGYFEIGCFWIDLGEGLLISLGKIKYRFLNLLRRKP